MRVRITTSMQGELDGINLTRLHVGRVYDVATSLGTYVVASGYATPVIDDGPAVTTPGHAVQSKADDSEGR